MQVFLTGTLCGGLVEAQVSDIALTTIVFKTPVADGPNACLKDALAGIQITNPSTNKTAISPTPFRYFSLPVPLTIATTTLPNGTNGTAYSATFVATGGTKPYTWAVVSGALPTGLTLDGSTGVISGTPTVLGTFTFSVTVADSASHTATANLSIKVNSSVPLAILTTSPLPDATNGTPYTFTLSATGGTTPYTWSNVGALPTGLTLDGSTGLISGTPTLASTFNFSVTVADSASHTATANLSIKVNSSVPLAIVTTSPLPDATSGTPYTFTLSATGGTTPYTWSNVGVLPTGLTLNGSTGLISGTPTVAGTFTFSVTVADSASHTATANLSIKVNSSVPLSIVTTSPLPDATNGTIYTFTLSATGGTTPYTWSNVGALPTGLTLNGSTGVISGTPTVAGTFNFSVTVTDSASHTATANLSIKVN
jgi:hypothetical protein